ncbi:serine protease 1-like [Cochliomyia hominivorax]
MKFLVVLALTLACVSAATVGDTTSLFRNKAVEGRITNGKPAKPGQFPYQVGLLKNRSDWCGGSLISDSWILTAAHCTNGTNELVAFLGSTEIQVAQIVYQISLDNIYQHKYFTNFPQKENDISLIKIPRVTFTSEIQPVRLPAIADSYSTYAGEYAIASGWGKTSDSEQYVANELNYARFEILSNSECGNLSEQFLCVATPHSTSICKGDSGGPLVLENSKILVGVSSFVSHLGCESGIPAGFVRVTTYLDWIRDITGIYY